MSTPLHQFYDSAQKWADQVSFLTKKEGSESFSPITWGELLDQVIVLSDRLQKMGGVRGDSVAILSNTRYEWTVIDLAVMAVGAVTIPIYHTLSDDQILYILNHSKTKVLFIENHSLLEKISGIEGDLEALDQLVMIEDEKRDAAILSFSDILSEKVEIDRSAFAKLIQSVNPGDVATCVYTSGTTGEPKGVELTHSNISAEVEGLSQIFSFDHSYIGLLFLPLAHVIARAMQFYQLSKGFITAYAESIDKLSENLIEVRPHFIVVVPRILEKIYEKVLEEVDNGPRFRRFVFHRVLNRGRYLSKQVRKHQKISFLKRFQFFLIRKLIFSKLVRKLGGRLEYIISGGAPLDKGVAEFFHVAGLLTLEGYGLTETIAAITINRPNDFKFGTVGKPLDGVLIKIADDGEVVVKGPQVFRRYREPVQVDDCSLTEDGWFSTGDIGEFSRDGFLRLTGRKKELIVTAGGKNVAPQRVENIMRTSPYISDIVVYGDRMKYLIALVTLNFENLERYAREHGIAFEASSELARKDETYQLIKSEIECKNRHLARHETIKKFAVIEHDFSQERGELTPTLKLRRGKIYQIYKSRIDAMYS